MDNEVLPAEKRGLTPEVKVVRINDTIRMTTTTYAATFPAQSTAATGRHKILLDVRKSSDNAKKLNQLRFHVSHQLGVLSHDYDKLGNQGWTSGYVENLANLQSRFQEWQSQFNDVFSVPK
ncbi:MAG: hypothetical protein Q9213_005607 [Squamulea squamosa]